MLLIIYIPVFQVTFGTVPLVLRDWLIVIFTSITVLMFIEVQKTMVNVELKQAIESNLHQNILPLNKNE